MRAPLNVKDVREPTLVRDDAVTPEASVAPVSVPAGAITAAVVMPVTKPLLLNVTTGIAVEEPVVAPVATVASVVAKNPAVVEMSPVNAGNWAAASVPVTPVERGSPVAFVSVPEAGVPRTGVTSVGDVANTSAPVPVSLVTAAIRLALDGVPRKVATFAPRLVMPVPPLATGRVPVTPVVRDTLVTVLDAPLIDLLVRV